MKSINHPLQPPTASLPSLAHLPAHSACCIQASLDNLRKIYFTPLLKLTKPPRLIIPKRTVRLRKLAQNDSVPDSGYASVEEGEDSIDAEEGRSPVLAEGGKLRDESIPVDLGVLHADAFERTFAIKWLTGLIARSDTWIEACQPVEADERAQVLDKAASLLRVRRAGG